MAHPDYKGNTVLSVLSVILIIGGLASVFFYYNSVSGKTVQKLPSCQSKLNQIGKAIKCYMHDWDEKYPTNRLANGRLSYDAPLSKNGKTFQYSVNWVEALYPYIERVGHPGDNSSVWHCPAARPLQVTDNAICTYAINMNLLEQSKQSVTFEGNTMLIREMDRHFGAVCRPINISRDSNTRPKGAFLTHWDPELPPGTECRAELHGPGSIILFTDMHVKTISSFMMPTYDKLVWDNTTKQWWNAPDSVHRYIAINP